MTLPVFKCSFRYGADSGNIVHGEHINQLNLNSLMNFEQGLWVKMGTCLYSIHRVWCWLTNAYNPFPPISKRFYCPRSVPCLAEGIRGSLGRELWRIKSKMYFPESEGLHGLGAIHKLPMTFFLRTQEQSFYHVSLMWIKFTCCFRRQC